MSQVKDLPYTTIGSFTRSNGKMIEQYYLHYQGKSVCLGPVEYSVVLSLLDENGLDFANVEGECEASKNKESRNVGLSPENVRKKIFLLRKKITANFTDLHISSSHKGGTGSRLLTTKQIEDIHCRMTEPEKGFFATRDENGAAHLFFDKRELCSRDKKSVKPQEFALLSMVLLGYPIKFESRIFQREWKRRNLNAVPLTKANFRILLSNLRYIFEPAGWTITKSKQGGGISRDFTHELVPCLPDMKKPSRPTQKTQSSRENAAVQFIPATAPK